MDLSPSPSENKGTLPGRGQRTRQLNGLARNRDTISCHPLCCTNDLIDMKGRCCPKIVVSIPRSLFTSGQLRHIGGTVPKTALPLWRKVCEKREVDIISRYKWWINEELHRWPFDKPLKIVCHLYLKHLWTQTFFLVIAQWRFHSTWSTISFPKIRRKKNIALSTHPGTGVDGASGRVWKLADFLLKHV